MTVTVSNLQEHIETDLPSAALTRILNAEQKRVDRVVGTIAGITERKMVFSRHRIHTTRPISSITSITERRARDDDATTLTSSDYRQVSKRGLLRLSAGTNGAVYWGSEVVITYVPDLNAEELDLAIIELCKIAIELRGGIKSEKDGDYSAGYEDPKAARKSILDGIKKGLPLA